MLRIALYNIIFMYRYIVCRWLNIRNWLGVEFVSLNIHLFRLLFRKNAQKKRNDFHNLWIFLFYFKWSLCIWMGYYCGRCCRCRSIKPSTTLHNLCLINTFGLRFFIYWCRLFILFCIHFCDIVVIAFASSFVFFSLHLSIVCERTRSHECTPFTQFSNQTPI